MENAKAEVERPFVQEKELKQKSKRLAELDRELDKDRPDDGVVLEDEADIQALEAERKEAALVR